MTGPADVLIVGAGPAGASAALRALQLRPDARVVLVDAADFPRDKACGDGIAPHALDLLARLGVPDAVAGYPPVGVLAIRSPGGEALRGRPARPNWVVPRAVFDARLVAAAVARGAELVRHRVRRVTARPGHVEVDGGLAGRVLIGADGANGVVRGGVGLAGTGPAALAIAVRGYAPAPPAGEPEQLIAMTRAGWPAYAWSFPIGDGRANVGFGKHVSALGREGRRSGKAELFDRLVEELPAAAGASGLRAHHLPLSPGRPRQPDGRVLLAGDALSLINPLTGEGIYYAVASGRLAGEAAVLPGGTGAGAAHRRALRRQLGAHLRHTDALAWATRHAPLVDAGVRAAGRDRAVFDALVELGLGRGVLTPRLLARVVASYPDGTAVRRPGRSPG